MIAELARREAELEEFVVSREGLIEERDAELRNSGTYAAYAEIFSTYLDLCSHVSLNLEALKRAAFLAWYEVSEPPCFSGVNDLPSDARSRVASILETSCRDLDDEIKIMLAYYEKIIPVFSEALPNGSALAGAIGCADENGWTRWAKTPERMSNRGLMGAYWKSVFPGSAA